MEVTQKVFGDTRVLIWLHENKYVLLFKIILIHNLGTDDEDEQITDGFCKWDGCYEFNQNGSHHFCKIEDYINAFKWIEQKRLQYVKNAE